MSNNPFTVRGMIQNPADFIGRQDELRHIFSRIETLQSCSIVGERRIGKSSLLYHIVQTGNGNPILGQLRFFVYLDLSNAFAQTQADLLQTFLEKMSLNPEGIQPENKPNRNLMAFSNQLDRLEKEGMTAVLCLDEFEALLKYPNEFNDGFFNHLRSLINQRKLVVIVAAQRPLELYALEEKLTSPFFNLIDVQRLDVFSAKEVEAFIEYYDGQVHFTEQELFLINTYAEPHPLKLHIFCDQLMEARHYGWDKSRLLEEFERSCKNFFGGGYKLSQAKHSASSLFSGEAMGRWLDNLKKGRDLLGGE